MNQTLLVALLIGGFFLMNAPRTWSMPEAGQQFQAAFLAAEKKYNLPHNLLSRVGYQESHFRSDIIYGEKVSNANAQGIMQIVPKWHPDVDPLDPYDAIDYAASYLRRLYDRFHSWDKALAAYNWGPTALARAIDAEGQDWIMVAPLETQNYVAQITADIPGAV